MSDPHFENTCEEFEREVDAAEYLYESYYFFDDEGRDDHAEEEA